MKRGKRSKASTRASKRTKKKSSDANNVVAPGNSSSSSASQSSKTKQENAPERESQFEESERKTTAFKATEMIYVEMPRTPNHSESHVMSDLNCSDIGERSECKTSSGGTGEVKNTTMTEVAGYEPTELNLGRSSTMPDLLKQDDDGDTYLHIAVVQSNQRLVSFLVEAMGNTRVDVYNNLRQTPLHLAVITGQENLVAILIQSGCDVNAMDRHGQTPLHLACLAGDVGIVRVIQDATADDRNMLKVNAKNFEGISALHLAGMSGNRDLIGLVINMGADINTKDTSSGRTALHHAVEAGRYHVVDYLLSRGASANVPTFSGNTPLHTAAGRQMEEMIKLLGKYGADVNVANMEGDKPRVVHGSEQGKRQLEASRRRAKRPKKSESTKQKRTTKSSDLENT